MLMLTYARREDDGSVSVVLKITEGASYEGHKTRLQELREEHVTEGWELIEGLIERSATKGAQFKPVYVEGDVEGHGKLPYKYKSKAGDTIQTWMYESFSHGYLKLKASQRNACGFDPAKAVGAVKPAAVKA